MDKCKDFKETELKGMEFSGGKHIFGICVKDLAYVTENHCEECKKRDKT